MLLRGNEMERKSRLDYELLAVTVGLIVLPCTGTNFTFASVGNKYSGVLNHMLSLKLSPSTQVDSSSASIYGRRSKEVKNQKGGAWGRWSRRRSQVSVVSGRRRSQFLRWTWGRRGLTQIGWPHRSFVFRSHLHLVARWAWG